MKKVFAVGVLLVAAFALALITMVSAHEGREVGNYVITFGWRVEPAYTDLLNGPEVTIKFHDSGEPVLDAVDNLNIQVSLGPASKQLKLRPVSNEPGVYTADLIPTRPGDYAFHLTGKIGDTDVDETFTSADSEFSSVEPISDIQFPEK